MRKQLVLIIPIFAAMIGTLARVGLNSVNAQNMSPPESNMTGGNITIGNMTGENAGNMTTPYPLFCYRFQLLQVGKPRQDEDLSKF